jgi:hypothetical protein
MKKVLLAVAVLSLTACSSLKYNQSMEYQAPKVSSTVPGVPDWYFQKNKDDALYGVATGASTDMQFAVDKAMIGAKRELASNFSSHISSLMKDFSAQAGDNDSAVLQDISRTTKLVINKVNLIGVQRTEFKIDKEGKTYQAYVKLRYSIDDSNKLLLDEIRRNQRLAHKLESSKAFQELEREVNGRTEPENKPAVTGDTIQLLPVDNAEYKKRRDEALAKPGAVIGQVTVQ